MPALHDGTHPGAPDGTTASALGESVICALVEGDRVLCEWRWYRGRRQHCVLGGKMEPADRRTPDPVRAATVREVAEELGVTVLECDRRGEYVSDGIHIDFVRVTRWVGDVPGANRDNGNRLAWVAIDELAAGIEVEPLAALVAGLSESGGARRTAS